MDKLKKEQSLVEKHYGQNLRRMRTKRGMSQDHLASITPFSQPTISRYETEPFIDDEVLGHFARAFGVSVEDIKEYDGKDDLTVIVENNTFEEGSKNISGNREVNDNSTTQIFPIEKVIELYERLVKTERKNISLLEEQIVILKKEIEELKKNR